MAVKQIASLFDRIGLSEFLARQARQPAGFFANIGVKMMNKANRDLEYMGLELMDLKGNEHILEIGFGNGRIMEEMSKKLDSGKLYGIDISDKMIEMANYRLKDKIKKGTVELQKASVEKIPFLDASMDKVLSCNTVYFWPEPQQCAKEVLRVLKPGGTFYCGFRTREEMQKMGIVKNNREVFSNLFSEEELKKLLRETGFTAVEVKSRPGEPEDSHFAIATK